MTKEEFFKRCNEKHGYKYIYHDDYVNMKQKIKITCKLHGDFYQEPRHHVNGCGCPKCSHRSYKYTTDEFLAMAKQVHGDRYDYSKVEYNGKNKNVCIICPEHGEFKQEPRSHLSGAGCPKCADIIRSEKRKLGWENFIKKAIEVHGNRYVYDETFEYKNNVTKVPITCMLHGTFWQTPNKHLTGCGCPVCASSKLEEEISIFLNKEKINYIPQYNLPFNKRMRLDFYLPDYNVAIECQGGQHFNPVEYFGGNKEFERRKELDEMKYNYCKENGINIIYYTNLKCDKFLNETVIHNAEEILEYLKK